MRLFLSVPVPDDLTVATAPFLGDAFRPVPTGAWHLTLRFLGEADPDEVATAMEGFQADGPIAARYDKAGAFPGPKTARVVWLGVHADGLAAVAGDVRSRVANIGDEDGKDFVAHVTLGRCKRPQDVRVALSEVDLPRRPFVLDRVDLMASELTPQGPQYQVLRSWPLG